MTSSIRDLNGDDFDRLVRESDRPVLVDFHATWCPACRALAPTIEALADDFAGRATVATVDVDANKTLAERFEVLAIPTVLLFVGGDVAARFTGIHSREALARALDEAASRSAA